MLTEEYLRRYLADPLTPGIYDPVVTASETNELSQEHQEILNELTPDELRSLISLIKK